MPSEVAQALETGVRFVALGVFVVLFVLTLLDLYLELRRYHSLSHRIQGWANRHPVYGLAVVLLIGALIGHFFWQELTP